MFILLCRERTGPARLEVRPRTPLQMASLAVSIIEDCENSATRYFRQAGSWSDWSTKGRLSRLTGRLVETNIARRRAALS